MKQSQQELASTARMVGQRKFTKMPSKKQHKLLWALAKETQSLGGDRKNFEKRYHELQSWAGIDRYFPPCWLSDSEALSEYVAFHSSYSIKDFDFIRETDHAMRQISWQPRLKVDVVLDQVRSPYNVGSILRTIDNFGFQGLVHSTHWLRIDHPQLVKSARGCERWIPVKHVEDLPDYLRQAQVPVIGIEDDPDSISVGQWNPPENCILIVGNEEYGVAGSIRSCCDQMVHIPMSGYKKSMNVNQALAIVAFKIFNTYTNVLNR